MEQEEAIKMIDNYKNKLINPVEMLNWTYLRVLLNSITPDEWNELLSRSYKVLSR